MDRKSSSAKMKIKKWNTRSSTKDSVGTAKASGDCSEVSISTSHSQFFGKKKRSDEFQRITRDEYYGIRSSDTSSESFGCIHGPEGKLHTESEQLRRTFINELDPIPPDRAWNECPPALGWDMAKKLEFLVTDTAPLQQLDRLKSHLLDFARTSQQGYQIDILDSLCVILDFLETAYLKEPCLREAFDLLLKNIHMPVLLNKNTDIVTYFDSFANYMGFVGCLMVGLEDCFFGVVSSALLWHLSAPDSLRPAGAVRRRATLLAAAPALYDSAVRMLAVTTSYRFPTFLQMALLLACDSKENCIELLKRGIIENIFYRFDPYFPERKLPAHFSNPADPQDYNVHLGDSSVHMNTTLTLLLVLLTTLKQCCDENSKFCIKLTAPDYYAQRCFIWAYKYECRARGHQSERITMTVIASCMVRCFTHRLELFFPYLLLDVLSLSVATELPVRTDWVGTVNFNTSQTDVQFKKVLIYLSIDFIKAFAFNNFLLESRHWVMGLMYLLDPGLAQLRAKWSKPLYDELRLTALQALVCALPSVSDDVPRKCGLITRLMWYIEWYSSSPYELGVLYWCVRLMRATSHRRGSVARHRSVQDLLDTHGVIILMNLCSSLLGQSGPPVEMRQVILGVTLRLLTSAIAKSSRVCCAVYPELKWPHSVNFVARTMMDVVLQSLNQSYIISDRWLISLLNFIWEGIIWKEDYRKSFAANNGVHQLLDLISVTLMNVSPETKMTRPPVQCLALALVCDAVRGGDAVAQLVTWRAGNGASNAHPRVVTSRSTIATLLASVFRDECKQIGVVLDVNGVIQDLNNPLRSSRLRVALENPNLDTWVVNGSPVCYTAADLAGSRMSKAFALLQLLSEDLHDKTSLADQAYKLYKHIPLAFKDEVILVLCSHYLTLKIMETWSEVKVQSLHVEAHDADILDEFLHINKGWAREVKRQQEAVIEMERKKERDEENSLYSFLARVRVNTALDALREVRCAARAGDRARLVLALLLDAVQAHHRRSTFDDLDEPVKRTFNPALDAQNVTGQYVKTYNIPKKNAKK